MLIDFYIAFADTSNDEVSEALKEMVTNSSIPALFEYPDIINKSQRYACLRKLLKSDFTVGMPDWLEAMISTESQKNSSDSDRVEAIKLTASRKDTATK